MNNITRLKIVDPKEASGKTKELFNAIEISIGRVPNSMKLMGNSPAFLEGILNMTKALSKGSLGGRISELIALAVSESNGCEYCLSAHSFVGEHLLKMDAVTLEAARGGHSADARIDAILQFAKALVKKKGRLTDLELDSLKAIGLTDGEITEIIGHVGLNILTNYFHIVANPEIDLPVHVKPFAETNRIDIS